MKRQFKICVLAAVGLIASCASVPEAPLRGVTSLTDHVSPSGQAFSLAYMPDAGQVSVHVVWPNVYAHRSGQPLLSTLGVELMSTGGAAGRSAKQIKQDISALGSGASLVATPDHIYGTFTATTETLDETLSIARDVITTPELDELRFDVIKEAKRLRVEALQEKSSAVLWRTARKVLLGDSTLTDYWNSTPVKKVVSPLKFSELQRWHSETFTSNNVTVAIAGSIEANAAAQAIDQLLTGLPVASVAESADKLATPAGNAGVTVLLHDKTAPATLIAVIGLLPASSEGGEIADIIAVGALGGGNQSRLHSLNANNAVSVSASIANFNRDIRVFGINASVNKDSVSQAGLKQASPDQASKNQASKNQASPDQPSDNKTSAEDTLQSVREAYASFKSGDLDDQEVLRSVVPFVTSLRANDKKVDLVAYGLGQLLLDELPNEKLLTVMQDSLSLKADEINQRVVDRYPEWEDMVKVILSPDATAFDADCVVKTVEEVAGCEF